MTRRCRCTGTTHTCGIQGVQSPNVIYVGQGGPKGAQGTQGTQGPAGSGAQGTQGVQGLIGPGGGAQGTTGAQGATGAQGPAGAQGTTGSGTQGATGLQGNTGAQGPSGTQGVQGTSGPQGLQGVDGGGVTEEQLAAAIASAALGSTDDLPEGTTNLYYRPDRVSYYHTQGTSSSSWVIAHNLGFYPNIVVKDSAGSVVEGEIAYDSLNQVTLTFQAAFSGTAYLS